MKKWKIDRIISIATLAVSLTAVILVLKRPAPVAQPQPAAVASVNAQSFQQKIQQLEQPKEPGQPPAEVRVTAAEVSAAIAQAAGAIPTGAAHPPSSAPQTNPGISLSSPNATIAPGQPDIKDYQVNFDGNVARGQFLVNIGGKDVYVTLAGHLGSKDGYATFEPTEIKVGDLSVPVSLVNDTLQKRLIEQRDRLKLPDSVGDIRVEDGQLVVTQK